MPACLGWLLAVLPVTSLALLLLASAGWAGLIATAALLAAEIGCAIYLSDSEPMTSSTTARDSAAETGSSARKQDHERTDERIEGAQG